MYTPFVPQFYKVTTLDPRPRSSTQSTHELCDYGSPALAASARKKAGIRHSLHVDRLGTLERAQWTSVRRILLHSTRPPGPDQA